MLHLILLPVQKDLHQGMGMDDELYSLGACPSNY